MPLLERCLKENKNYKTKFEDKTLTFYHISQAKSVQVNKNFN